MARGLPSPLAGDSGRGRMSGVPMIFLALAVTRKGRNNHPLAAVQKLSSPQAYRRDQDLFN